MTNQPNGDKNNITKSFLTDLFIQCVKGYNERLQITTAASSFKYHHSEAFYSLTLQVGVGSRNTHLQDCFGGVIAV